MLLKLEMRSAYDHGMSVDDACLRQSLAAAVLAAAPVAGLAAAPAAVLAAAPVADFAAAPGAADVTGHPCSTQVGAGPAADMAQSQVLAAAAQATYHTAGAAGAKLAVCVLAVA